MRLPALLLLVIASAAPAAAQRLPAEAPRYVVAFRGGKALPAHQALAHGDYAWEGAKVGAVILGLPGIGIGYSLCAVGDNGHPTSFAYCAPRSLIGGLIGATVGAVIGGFIGSTIHRDPENTPQ